MAIQFNCPYCTASIRVPDAAAGKRGTCPKCSTQLIVPKVGPPPVPPSAAQPAMPPLPPTAPAGFPEIPVDLPAIAEAQPLAHVARQRARRKGTNPLIPLAAFGVVLGVVAYWMLVKPKNAIEGELSGEMLPGFKIPAVTIGQGELPLSDEEGSPAWEELIKHQVAAVRVPNAFQMDFEPGDAGVKISIQNVSGAEVFRVKPNTGIKKFFEQHGDKIARQQQKEFDEAILKFAADWQAAKLQGQPFVTEDYYETVGLNRLTGVMGYGLAAQVGERTYRAVHEDPERRLYFLLPQDTQEFVLKGRKLPGGDTPFESRLTVKVAESNTPTKSKEAEGTEPESQESPEAMMDGKTEPMMEP